MQVQWIAFLEYRLLLKFYKAENEGTQCFSRTVWLILGERKEEKGNIQTSSVLTKSGRSLVLSATVFPGGDI